MGCAISFPEQEIEQAVDDQKSMEEKRDGRITEPSIRTKHVCDDESLLNEVAIKCLAANYKAQSEPWDDNCSDDSWQTWLYFPNHAHLQSEICCDTMDKCREFLPNCFKTCQEKGKMLELKDLLAGRVKVFWSLNFSLRDKTAEQRLDIVRTKLPPHHVDKIKNGFKIPTFKMTITQKNNKYHASFERDGKTFKEPLILQNSEDVSKAQFEQWASVVLELVLLLFSCAGIAVQLEARQTARIAAKIGEEIAGSEEFQSALTEFWTKWNQEVGKWPRAYALFNLTSRLYAIGDIMKTFFTLVLEEMSWLDRLKMFVQVVAMIVMALATDGAFLVADIVLTLTNAYDFIEKIANLDQLQDILSEVQSAEMKGE